MTVALQELRGKWAVLLFHPLDFAFVCPTEIKELSRRSSELATANAEILAASVDSRYAHLAWQREIGPTPYPMLSDITKRVGREYEVVLEDESVALRGLFAIDPEGVVRYEFVHDLSTGRSADETLRVLNVLQTGELCPADWQAGMETLGVPWCGRRPHLPLLTSAAPSLTVASPRLQWREPRREVTAIPIPPLAFLPLDDRPCNRLFPGQLADIVGLDLVTPPRELLGWFTAPGDCEALADWLQVCQPNHAVVSLDMLCYGGLVAARSAATDTQTALRRLHFLDELKQQRPDLSLLVSSCLPRLGTTVSCAGALSKHQDLVDYSVLTDRLERLGDEEARSVLEQVRARLDPQVLASYLEVRRRNHEVAQEALRLVSDGVLAFLILAQEDAAPLGLHVGEQEALRALIRELNIGERVALHPGADETGMVLMARHCAAAAGRPPRVCADYATDAGSQVTPRYEDRPLRSTVLSQIRAAGAEASPPGQADAMLFIHTPIGEQMESVDAPPQGRAPSVALQADSVAERVRFAGQSGAIVGVADLVYANGGDPELFAAFQRGSAGRQLRAYAGWNTAANALGTAISQLCLEVVSLRSGSAARDASRRFLACRIADDYCYQTHVRRGAVEKAHALGADEFALGEAWGQVEEYVRVELVPLATTVCSHTMGVAWGDSGWEFTVSLPWHRAFEVEVAVKAASPSQPRSRG